MPRRTKGAPNRNLPGDETAARLAMRTPRVYKALEGGTAGVIFFQIIFAPWAFGTTDDWSEWTLAVSGYTLGALLIGKRLVCRVARYKPVRWGASSGREPARLEFTARALALLTVLILAYTCVSALNYRATFNPNDLSFRFRENYASALPHSYSAKDTWDLFWKHLGLALSFWAIRDWLLAKSSRERFLDREFHSRVGIERQKTLAALASSLPDRLRILLMVLFINGGFLALVGILQRINGTDKLLWLVQPYWRKTGELHFGPYAYRTNAAQYFNLLWPVCLGYWLAIRKKANSRKSRTRLVGTDPSLALTPCLALMMAAPYISTSRGGALIAAALLAPALGMYWASRDAKSRLEKAGFALFALCAIGIAAFFGGEDLVDRLKKLQQDPLAGRGRIYEVMDEMEADSRWLGLGPGTFEKVYFLYRSNDDAWEAFGHDDWRELQITYGHAGFGLLIAALAAALAPILFRRTQSSPLPRQMTAGMVAAIGGVLIHAKFDFPFQVHSIAHLVLILLAVTSGGLAKTATRPS